MSGTAQARSLRKRATDAEQLLWRHLRDRRLGGFKFRRQHPLGPYVLDFFCEAQGLVVELDGSQHADQLVQDSIRTKWLEARGKRVMRFWNNEVYEDLEGVLQVILETLEMGRQ
jgi:adenine-specific DNA-methyltransferase